MKKLLGKIFLIFLTLCLSELSASTYEWKASINKREAYLNEAIYLKYICSFSDRGELYAIDFNPVGDYENYTIKLLSQSERIFDGKRVNSYEFVAFVKRSGVIEFAFDMSMKKTTKDAIENTVLGRDNFENEEFNSIKMMRQESLLVDVKESSALVGEFRFEVKKDKAVVKAYEPFHMQVTISGNGNFSEIKLNDFKIDGVKVFVSKAIQNIKLTKDGYNGSWNQKFAFVSEKDFTVPQISLEYFDLKDERLKSMGMESLNVKVKKAFIKEELLDEEESRFEFSYDFIYYLLTFIAGFLVAKIKLKKHLDLDEKSKNFNEKINNSKSLEELVIILALRDSKKYEKLILQIEKKEVTSLANIKKELLN